MPDLAPGAAVGRRSAFFLVAPDDRRQDVVRQRRRPAFPRVRELGMRYLPCGELTRHAAAIQRFGAGIKPLMGISQAL